VLGVGIATLAGGALSCTPVVEPEVPEADLTTTGRPLGFDYAALDGTRVTGESTRGRITVVVFMTTYDLRSQIIVRELSQLMHTRTPRFNTLGVVLEPPKNAPLVDAFAETMELSFPLALSPSPEAFDEGQFGKVDAVPTVVILDQRGVQRFRRSGHMSTAELDAAISQANR
jgi:hypothetical protein